MNANISDSDPTNFKVCIIGEEGVGKTAILNRYVTGSFVANYKPTVAASFMSAHEIVGDHTVTLNIWDTAGQEKYQSMMPLYLRNVDCIILVFDVTKPSSATYVERWLENELPNVKPTPLLFVCGNKMDQQQTFSTQSIENAMKEKNIPTFFTSSLNGLNIAAVFSAVGAALDEENQRKRPQMHKLRNKKETSSSCC